MGLINNNKTKKKDLLGVRRWQGRSFFVPEFQCWCNATTLSGYMTPCQPLMICTQFCISRFLNSLGNIVAPKSKPLPNYQENVLNRIKACQWDYIYCQIKVL